MKKALLLASFLFFSIVLFSGTCTSPAGTHASWNAASWSCTDAPFAGPPGCDDAMVVNGTINVSADVDYSGCPSPIVLTINGTLNFNVNGVRFKLPAGSTVILGPTGKVQKGFAGGGSSTLISIGGSNVWTAGDGTLTGPTILGAPLPIELLEFSGSKCRENVCLAWTTASETDNDFFTIERTLDGIVFENIAEIDGAGNSTSPVNYFYTDYSAFEGTSYYRLKQTDFNGNFSYSALAPVNYYDVQELSFAVYPNPNSGTNISLEVNGPLQEEILVVVKDITGKENYSKVVVLQNTIDNVIVLDPSNKLGSGIYFITATSQQSIYNKKMIVN
ncbi:MAG TPA: T9SS type A sorting domain-containing protein [Bacteroidia bacterium]|jgi:hypothetical protein